MGIPDFNTRVDISQYPNLDSAGKQLIKELEWQMYKNPNWTMSERAGFGSLRTLFLANQISVEDAIAEAYMKGVQATQESLFENGKDSESEV